jgi:uncharacterized protein YciI
MFIVKLKYLKTLAEMDQYRPAHLEFLDKYYAKQIFIASGRQNPPVGGIIIAATDDLRQLEEILQEDPFNIAQLAEYEIIEFTANKYHPAIKDLIK